MEEFRGLASVVQAWRDVRENEWMTIDEMDHDPGFRHLVEVLNMADEYMTEVESQQPVNLAAEVAHTDQAELDRISGPGSAPLPTTADTPVFDGDLSPVGLLTERQCGMGARHVGHEWPDPLMGMEVVWCNGVVSVPPGV